jgi:hypothetical protein
MHDELNKYIPEFLIGKYIIIIIVYNIIICNLKLNYNIFVETL